MLCHMSFIRARSILLSVLHFVSVENIAKLALPSENIHLPTPHPPLAYYNAGPPAYGCLGIYSDGGEVGAPSS
jgi:hypothetical protein